MSETGPFKHLTVIGLGLIGGSMAMAAHEVYPDLKITAVDANPEPLQYGLKAGFIHQVARQLPERFADDHLIILACHLEASLEILKNLPPVIKDQSIVVSDVGSCKRKICQLGEELLPTQFIGGHPMSGKEFSGIAHSTSLLFSNKSFILCPSALAGAEPLNTRFQNLMTFIKGLGAIPRTLDPETHDRYMAYVSHLPQLYSILLTNLIERHEPGHLLSYHGGGIDDQLRLAASPHAMWGEVFIQNQDNLRDVLHELSELMADADRCLDQPEFEQWFERSNKLHASFHKFRLGR